MAVARAFDAFAQGAPRAVLTRLVAERIVDDHLLGTLFQQHAFTQYDREIAITHLVEVMPDVACGIAPFGAGPRFCPGRNLALLEIKAVMAMLCRNFDVSKPAGAPPVGEQFAFAMMPNGLNVKIDARR